MKQDLEQITDTFVDMNFDPVSTGNTFKPERASSSWASHLYYDGSCCEPLTARLNYQETLLSYESILSRLQAFPQAQ